MFLYVMGTEMTVGSEQKEGPVKIGYTAGRVEERRKQLQTGCPFQISKVWHSDDIPGAEKCERILHVIFAERKTSGEWFNVPMQEAVLAAERVCKENGDDDTMKHIRTLYERVNELEQEIRILRNAQSRLVSQRTQNAL